MSTAESNSLSTSNLPDHGEINVATALRASQLAYRSSQVESSEELTTIALSPDGEYLATAAVSGTVSIRKVRDNGRKIQSLNAGTSVKVSALLWGPVTQAGRPLFVAASNGFINCVTYQGTDFNENPPKLTSGFLPALVTSMALNPSSSILAVAYAYTVKLLDLPLTGTDANTARAYSGKVIWRELSEDGWSTRDLPVRSQSWPVKLEWLSDTVLCIGLFTRIVALDISTPVPKTSWTIEAPHASQLGSFAISPSRKLIAATNLHSGVDWFDVNSCQFISTTTIEDDYLQRNYILPISFLGEKSFVCGHNTGSAIIGGHGVDGVQQISSGTPVRYPSQFLAVSRPSPDSYLIAWAVSECLSPTIQVVAIGKSPSVEGPSTATDSTPPAPIREPLLLLLLQALLEMAVSSVKGLGIALVKILKLKIVIVLLTCAVSITVFTGRERHLTLHPLADAISQNPFFQLLKRATKPWANWDDTPRTTILALESSIPDEVVFSYFKPLAIDEGAAIGVAIEGQIEASREAAPLPEDMVPEAENELEDDDLEFEEVTLNPTVTITKTEFITITETVVSTTTLHQHGKSRRTTRKSPVH